MSSLWIPILLIEEASLHATWNIPILFGPARQIVPQCVQLGSLQLPIIIAPEEPLIVTGLCIHMHMLCPKTHTWKQKKTIIEMQTLIVIAV